MSCINICSTSAPSEFPSISAQPSLSDNPTSQVRPFSGETYLQKHARCSVQLFYFILSHILLFVFPICSRRRRPLCRTGRHRCRLSRHPRLSRRRQLLRGSRASRVRPARSQVRSRRVRACRRRFPRRAQAPVVGRRRSRVGLRVCQEVLRQLLRLRHLPSLLLFQVLLLLLCHLTLQVMALFTGFRSIQHHTLTMEIVVREVMITCSTFPIVGMDTAFSFNSRGHYLIRF